MPTDPIAALRSLGYTEREAAFLYIVAIHSGYFLRRQFCAFIDRELGYLAQHFIEKAQRAGHIEILEFDQGRRVYHLFSKPIYQLFGTEDSQNRRRKGDAQIRVRLMVLDYVIENPDDHYLETGEQKRTHFARTLRLREDVFTDSAGRLLPFLAAFPIALTDQEHPLTAMVRFVFIDEGLLSLRKFRRFLVAVSPLMYELHAFELIYVACSEHNFGPAGELFMNEFRPQSGQQQRFFDESQAETGRRARKIGAQMTTILFNHSYPKMMRSEGRQSGYESGHESARQKVSHAKT